MAEASMPICAPMNFGKCEENSAESESIAKKSKIEEPESIMCLWKKADTEAATLFVLTRPRILRL